jgi:murein DD-endopeptidase MepM/ murein hydrolase activator NlpD
MPVHGACDLVAPAGTGVLAIQNGTIVKKYPFVTYCKGTQGETTTWAIEVAHERCLMRYCEISPNLPNDLKVGSEVTEGDLIAFVGLQCNGTMLHLEMFDDPDRRDDLTVSSNPRYLYVPQANYLRRNDLLDPTWLLDRWISEVHQFRRGGNVVW